MPEQAGRPRSGVSGRELAAGACLGAALVLGSVAPAVAAEEVAAAVPAEGAPSIRCQITDGRLAEISGMASSGEHLLAVNDGGDQVAVHRIDAGCQVVEVHTAAIDPYDPEDVALGADGTIWIADTGDNNLTRSTVALIAVRPDGTTGVYRLAYPDGPHDTEALLLAPDGTPYLVTKEVLGASVVYRPAAALVEGGTVALVEVAAVSITLTGTPGGPVGRAGQLMITGGAVSASGAQLALRTYTDAYVWRLAGSDVAAALAVAPVHVPLPESPQGEAISFTADGLQLLVASEGLPSDVTVVPLPAAVAAAAENAVPGDVPSLTDLTRSGLSPVSSAVIAAVVASIVVWLAGLLGLLRRRL